MNTEDTYYSLPTMKVRGKEFGVMCLNPWN